MFSAPLPLEAIVIGAGLSGLSVALALQRSGHRVALLDSASDANAHLSSRDGVRSPPNMTRILNAWGFGPFLERHGKRCPQWSAFSGQDELLGTAPLFSEIIAELDAEFYFLEYSTLYTELKRVAEDAGVDIHFGTTVIDLDAEAGQVELENGEQVEADLIVVANGFESQLARITQDSLGDHEEQIFEANFTTLLENLNEDDRNWYLSFPGFCGYLGDGFFASWAGINTRGDLAIHFSKPVAASELDNWRSQPITPELLDKIGPLTPRIKALAHCPLLDGRAEIRVMKQPHDSFVDGRVVVVGHAAHPMNPSSSCAMALAFEDAEVLGNLLSRIQNKSELVHFLSGYEEIRRERCHVVQGNDNAKTRTFSLQYGPAQQMRDAYLRESLAVPYEDMDENKFAKMWGSEIETYKYHAKESVEDWWTKWSAFFIREDGRHNRPVSMFTIVSVSTSVLE